jgi:uncharacterized membrane protein YedE/YeeE
MGYLGSGSAAGAATTGTLAFTGSGDTSVMIVATVLLFVVGAAMIVLSRLRKRRDMANAGIIAS